MWSSRNGRHVVGRDVVILDHWDMWSSRNNVEAYKEWAENFRSLGYVV